MGLQLGGLFIPYYGLCIVLGASFASLAGWVQARIFQKSFDDLITLAGCAALGGILGAKLLYLAVSWREIDWLRLGEPAYLAAVMGGGFVFYGGLIGAALGAFAGGRIFRISVQDYLRLAVPCLPLAHAFGRLGCGLAGCCYGIPCDGPGAVVYENSLVAPAGIPLFPVQFLEAVLLFALALSLFLYTDVNPKRPKKYGWTAYLLTYAVLRFFLEYLRGDDRGNYLGWSTSQWLSLILFGAAAAHTAYAALSRRRREKQAQACHKTNKKYERGRRENGQ